MLASDAHPKMIGHFSESLTSRFVAGMVVRVESPDFEVRAAVLRRQAQRLKVNAAEAVIHYIAETFCANIRELEGALLKVVALSQVTGEPLTLALAERGVRDLVRQTAPVVMLSDIEAWRSTSGRAGDPYVAESRTIALARSTAMYFARKHTKMSFPEIGRYLGNKNHSTVILACRRVSRMLQSNASVTWNTAGGLREHSLAVVIAELEEQFHAGRTHQAGAGRPVGVRV